MDPILTENLGYYLDLYNTWSSYEPESKGILIAYASIHGNTGKAAEKLAEILRSKGAEKVVVSDLAREDMAEVIEDAFRYDRMIVAQQVTMAAYFLACRTSCIICRARHIRIAKLES